MIRLLTPHHFKVCNPHIIVRFYFNPKLQNTQFGNFRQIKYSKYSTNPKFQAIFSLHNLHAHSIILPGQQTVRKSVYMSLKQWFITPTLKKYHQPAALLPKKQFACRTKSKRMVIIENGKKVEMKIKKFPFLCIFPFLFDCSLIVFEEIFTWKKVEKLIFNLCLV